MTQDKRQKLYEWLLRCCLEICEIPLLIFVTDADPAIIATISIVFSETHHMQCLYHLYQNLSKNLHSCLGSLLYQEFLKDFKGIQHSYCENLIYNAYYKQMCQSVCYRTYQVQFSEIPVSDDGSFEPFFDKVEDSTKSLIEADED
ncbi:8411_t:CDS:2 [Funneliformis caledonium]|uniref:8411_t:CDS:1 n=1 Tax=Funneliformis caledonium TaxID=1117310 RepID=A0A9N8ZFL8_9GLOM|nr:8411_t:CDS:2 [Funneliformis caledonium]